MYGIYVHVILNVVKIIQVTVSTQQELWIRSHSIKSKNRNL